MKPLAHAARRPGRCRAACTLRRCWVAVALLALTPAGVSAPPPGANPGAMDSEAVAETEQKLGEMERRLRLERSPDEDTLNTFLGRIPAIHDFASRCVRNNEGRLETIEGKLDTLGDVAGTQSVGVEQQRSALERRRQEVERQLQLCRVLLLRANELQDRLTQRKQEWLAERLREREDPVWAVLADNLREPGQLWNTARLFLLRSSGLERLSWVQLIGGVGLLLVCAGASIYARRPMFLRAAEVGPTTTLVGWFGQSVLACAAKILPPLVTSIVASVYLTIIRYGEPQWSLITLLAYGLAGYFVFIFLVRLFLAPCEPAQPAQFAPAETLRRLARRLRVLALLVLLMALFSATLAIESFPEPVRDLLRAVAATLLVIELTRIIWIVGELLSWRDTRIPRLVLSAGMLFALGAEWLGYHNMAEYVVRGILGTVLALGLTLFVWYLLDEFFEGLDEGRHRWQRSLRSTLGVGSERRMPGLIWLRLLVALGVWSGFVLLVLLSWGLSQTGLAWLLRALNEGFSIARFEVVPIRVLWGLVTLIVLLGVSGWVQQRMSQRWLRRSRMERGAREALVMISGYVGGAIAILVGLGVAGVDFTNIALIAGALSVGIGFGLQNVVNNFVSGLILLFERPVKTDDWVVVGGTEGFVKRISIRSTQLQTFDGADVIVPNSELIQSQVTNWMLRDPIGRLTAPVRVAFGSDTEQVQTLLLEIAHEHAHVITDPVLAPAPEVVMRRFGESGYEFELRVFIRDIGYFVIVQSELNMTIERRFRDHGIVIPYPQCDVRFSRMPPDPGMLASRSARPSSLGGRGPDEMGEGDGGDG